MFTHRSRVGDRVTLTCACAAEVVVPTIIRLPRHHVVRILTRGKSCRGLGHARGRRAVVRWRPSGARRIYTDVHQA
jgi:hypothetical protein